MLTSYTLRLFLLVLLITVEAMRKYDVVVFGATGFTGRLVAKYLAATYPTLKWSIAGRNLEKLGEVNAAAGTDVDCLVYDLGDAASIDNITQSATCVLSTAGPYAIIGMPLVESCVRSGAHYVDITGEPPFVKNAIDSCHENAQSKRLKIVNCCGFDCIPSDMGCEMMIEALLAKELSPLEVRYITMVHKGGVSGGTIASGLNILKTQDMAKLENPYYLCKEAAGGATIQRKNQAFNWFDFDKLNKVWTGAHIMQAGWRYGRNFVWSQRMKAKNMLAAFAGGLLSVILKPLLNFRSVLNFLQRFLPKPGEGPTEEVLNTGLMKERYWARGLDKAGREVVIQGGLDASGGDPGYKLTALMVAESALCTVFDSDALPDCYGVLTPSSAFGSALRKRLTARGFKFYLD